MRKLVVAGAMASAALMAATMVTPVFETTAVASAAGRSSVVCAGGVLSVDAHGKEVVSVTLPNGCPPGIP